jgi:hypothetical protein
MHSAHHSPQCHPPSVTRRITRSQFQAQDLPDSPIVVAQVLHRDGDLRIVADVLDFARQLRAAIQVGAQGDVIVADQRTP